MVKKETVEELADRIKGNEPAQETGGSVNIEELADKIMADGGNNAQSFEASTRNVISNIDPFSTSGFEQEYTPEQHEFDQGLFADATSGLYNSLVIDLGEGITNLIPTIAQAAGDEGEWASKWKNNTTSWFDAQRTIYSDKANAPIEGFSDITSAHVAQGIGQGIGFILGIVGGAGWAGAASKGGKALNTINVLTKAGKTAEAAAVLSKTGKNY